MTLLLLLLPIPSLVFQPTTIFPRTKLTPLRMSEEDTSGKGFGAPDYAAVEARGRAELERLKAASAERGYDNTLQGLQDPSQPGTPQPTPKELAEFQSQLTLGLAGFLIVGGVISLFIGGSLWEPKGFNEDGTPPADETPAFGFVPKPMKQKPAPEEAPSWASPPQ